MTHDRPLTIHVYECGCPGGRYTASIPRHGIRVLDDDPSHAAMRAVQQHLTVRERELTAGTVTSSQPPG